MNEYFEAVWKGIVFIVLNFLIFMQDIYQVVVDCPDPLACRAVNEAVVQARKTLSLGMPTVAIARESTLVETRYYETPTQDQAILLHMALQEAGYSSELRHFQR